MSEKETVVHVDVTRLRREIGQTGRESRKSVHAHSSNELVGDISAAQRRKNSSRGGELFLLLLLSTTTRYNSPRKGDILLTFDE